MITIGKGSQRSDRIPQWIVGVFIAATGIAAQILDVSHGVHTQSHLLFGVLLSGGVLCRFKYGLWTHRASPVEIAVFSRQLTRIVYLLLYTLLAVKLALNLVAAGANVTAPDVFQPYLASGLAAILLTRLLALYSMNHDRGPSV